MPLPFSDVITERLQPILSETHELNERFSRAGFSLYLVGGVVRDAMTNRLTDVTDLDYTTDATPDDVVGLTRDWADALWEQGKRFGTIAMKRGGRLIEITTHRGEAYDPDSRKPTVAFSADVEVDLSRRDFTVNAMALRVPDLTLVDPFDGISDLAQNRLRTPLDPDVSFADDPLRMLRAARFAAQLSLAPSDELLNAMERLRSRLSIVSRERIRDEFDKLMVLGDPSPALWMLIRTGVLGEFIPEIPALALEQDPIHHHKDVLAHTVAVVAKASPDRILRLACLFHDIGKPATRSFDEHGVSFHHHDVVGARMTRKRMRELKYSSDDVEAVSNLVALHLRFHTYAMGWTDSAIRRYVRDAGPHLDRLNELTRCDCTTRNKKKAEALDRRMDELEAEIVQLRAKEELDAIRPELDGNEVMEHLGIPPGKLVGEAMRHLLQIRLDEGPVGRDECVRRLDEWWATR